MSQLRDKTLVQAQAQVDQLAASLASALVGRHHDPAPAAHRSAGGLRSRSLQRAPGNRSTSPTLTRDQHPAPGHACCAWTIRPRCRCPNTARQPERSGDRRQFLRRAWRRSWRNSTRDRQPAHLQFSNPPGRLLRVVDDGTSCRRPSTPPPTTTTVTVARRRHVRSCRCSPTDHALYRRRSPAAARR